MRLIRVCHMTSVHARNDVRIFQKECHTLSEAGFKVYLVVNDMYGDEVKDGIHILSTSYKCKNRFDRVFHAAGKVYKKAVQIDADIYHLHDPELLLYGYLLKKRGKKVVFDSHEFTWKQLECRDYLPRSIRRAVSFLYKKCEEKIVSKIDAVIVPCTYDGKSYFGDKCRKEIMINNFPNLDESDAEDVQFDSRKRQACYIGGLTKERGVVQIAQACKRAGIPLVLAGTFSTDKLEKEILGISHSIEYKGRLEKPEVKKLLDESYIGLSVLQDEGQYRYVDNLPTKVYEYMASGMPVIISDFPYEKRIIHKYKCGRCVNVEDVNEIAANMKWLLDHPQEAEEMGKNGKKIVMQKFNWKIEEKKLLKLYWGLLKNSSGNRKRIFRRGNYMKL